MFDSPPGFDTQTLSRFPHTVVKTKKHDDYDPRLMHVYTSTMKKKHDSNHSNFTPVSGKRHVNEIARRSSSFKAQRYIRMTCSHAFDGPIDNRAANMLSAHSAPKYCHPCAPLSVRKTEDLAAAKERRQAGMNEGEKKACTMKDSFLEHLQVSFARQRLSIHRWRHP